MTDLFIPQDPPVRLSAPPAVLRREIEKTLAYSLALRLVAVADKLIARDELRTREGLTIRDLGEWVRLVVEGEWP